MLITLALSAADIVVMRPISLISAHYPRKLCPPLWGEPTRAMAPAAKFGLPLCSRLNPVAAVEFQQRRHSPTGRSLTHQSALHPQHGLGMPGLAGRSQDLAGVEFSRDGPRGVQRMALDLAVERV